jgi:hypothetical protein
MQDKKNGLDKVVVESSNSTPLIYTATEQPIIDQLLVVMPQTAKSTIEEGRLWNDLRTLVKKVEGRFDLLCESLNTTRDHAYYSIKVYEASLPQVELPATVKTYLEATGLNLTMPENPTAEQQKEITANQNAARKAFQKEGITGEPTRKQLASINERAITYLDVDEPTEQENLRDAINSIFLDSYLRVVGTPRFGKKEKGKPDRPFLGYFPVGTDKADAKNLVKAPQGGTAVEVQWVKMMEQTLRSITGKSGMETWLSGGPDLLCLGRGTDQFKIQDLRQEAVA